MKKRDISLIRSFAFAFNGIFFALRNERNLRIHFAAAAYTIGFSLAYYNFSKAEYALLILVIGLVITCELFNTAIEKTVDIETPVYNGLAKIAKDVAAGAVLVSSITAVVVSFCLFYDPDILYGILMDMLNNIIIYGSALAVTVVWIIQPWRKTNKRSPE